MQISELQGMLEQLSELKSIIESQEFEKYNISDEDLENDSVGSSFSFKLTSFFVIVLVSGISVDLMLCRLLDLFIS